MAGGIYTITTPSGDQYVGATTSFAPRWNTHKSQLRCGRHPNKGLTAAYAQYGDGALVFSQAVVCDASLAPFYEQMVINSLRPKFNTRLDAGSNQGFRHSPETKAAMRAARAASKYQTHDAGARARMSAATRGKPRTEAQKAALLRNQALAKTPEAIAKRLATLKPLFASPEYRAAMSAMSRECMAKNPPTKEWREKVSAGTKAGQAAAKARRAA